MNFDELLKIVDSLSKEEKFKLLQHIQQQITEKEFYSIEDIANLFGINWRTVQRYIKIGKIKAIKFGRQWRIPKKEFIRLKNEGLD
uniref:DNA-binding protein n=1 Tax=Marinitoga okinawensis TaxID=389480 RepID=A0A9C7LLQ3_9BACT|nr:DUF3853 family protein [Marinitoga okinawensis]CAI4093964.1 DNA-binding protein [Marinitoga okinawensis]